MMIGVHGGIVNLVTSSLCKMRFFIFNQRLGSLRGYKGPDF